MLKSPLGNIQCLIIIIIKKKKKDMNIQSRQLLEADNAWDFGTCREIVKQPCNSIHKCI